MAATPIESAIANRPEVAVFRNLHFPQPAQGLQASFKDRCLSGSTPAKKQGMRQFGIVVSQLRFKPAPVRLGTLVKPVHEPGGERFTSLIDQPVTAQPPQ